MSPLINSSILIPALPCISALFVGVLLISFNRTMNRLTKPVSFLIISSTAFSSLYATFLYLKHISGDFQFKPLGVFDIDYSLVFDLNDFSEGSSAISGVLIFFLMLISFIKLPRSKGYVLYMVSFSFLTALLFFVIFCANSLRNLV